MNKRIISPEFFTDPDLGSLPASARLVFLALILIADDYGKGEWDERKIHHLVFGYSDVSIEETVSMLALLSERLRSILVYSVDGRMFFKLMSWERWQKLYYRKASRIPDPPEEGARGVVASKKDEPQNPLKEIIAVWEEEMGIISPTVAANLERDYREWLRVTPDALEVIKAAIRESRKNGVTSYAYVAKVLDSWRRDKSKVARASKDRGLNESMTREEIESLRKRKEKGNE